MFFKFNSTIGRLSPASPFEAYNPAGLTPPLSKSSVAEPDIRFETAHVKLQHEEEPTHMLAATTAAGKHGGPSLGLVPASQGYAKILQLQKKFLVDDGRMVWQKMGIRDTGLYSATVAMSLAGTAYVFYLLYKMSFPKKKTDD